MKRLRFSSILVAVYMIVSACGTSISGPGISISVSTSVSGPASTPITIIVATSVPPTSAPKVPTTAAKPTTATSSSVQSPPEPANLPSYRLLKVVDGDTIDIDYNGRQTPVRLIGLNTPETVDPNRPVQCYGPEASARAKVIFSGVDSVQLESDPTQGDRDKYDRLLRFVWLPNGTLFDLEMISEGYAYEYTYNLPYKYQAQFKQAQQTAKIAKIGLWSPQTCNGHL